MNLGNIKLIFSDAENQTQGSWMRSASSASVLCRGPLPLFSDFPNKELIVLDAKMADNGRAFFILITFSDNKTRTK